jgi:hypothetical protein
MVGRGAGRQSRRRGCHADWNLPISRWERVAKIGIRRLAEKPYKNSTVIVRQFARKPAEGPNAVGRRLALESPDFTKRNAYFFLIGRGPAKRGFLLRM